MSILLTADSVLFDPFPSEAAKRQELAGSKLSTLTYARSCDASPDRGSLWPYLVLMFSSVFSISFSHERQFDKYVPTNMWLRCNRRECWGSALGDEETTPPVDEERRGDSPELLVWPSSPAKLEADSDEISAINRGDEGVPCNEIERPSLPFRSETGRCVRLNSDLSSLPNHGWMLSMDLQAADARRRS